MSEKHVADMNIEELRESFKDCKRDWLLLTINGLERVCRDRRKSIIDLRKRIKKLEAKP